jgi:hypothetical protein
MHRLTGTRLSSRVGVAALAVAVAIGAWAAMPTPAAARFFVGIGVPFPGFYAPFPYYYPPPVYYPYYPPPPPAYYPPAYYPPPPQAAIPTAPAGAAPAAAQASAAITYTDRPAFKNAAGETCREYRGANGALGSACQDAGGQWRVAN